jgi:acetyl-CoA carboxylase biotin carboxyl carrier protein
MSDETTPALLDVVCGQVIRLLNAAGETPSRVRVSSGELSAELEWRPAEHAATSPMAVTPAGPVHTGNGHGRPAPAPPHHNDGPAPDAEERFQIRSPMVGTFYRSPEPGARPFVEVGSIVDEGTQVAILEAMKLMNPLEADRRGRVTEILVEDASPVEYDQPLFVLEPVER